MLVFVLVFSGAAVLALLWTAPPSDDDVVLDPALSNAGRILLSPSNTCQPVNLSSLSLSYEPSGVFYNPVADLLITCSLFQMSTMRPDGSEIRNFPLPNQDLEAVTVANMSSSIVYVAAERPKNVIHEYDMAEERVLRSFDLDFMLGTGPLLEGIAFVPDDTDPNGGLFYVNTDTKVLGFRLNLGSSDPPTAEAVASLRVTTNEEIANNGSKVGDLSFFNGTLYVLMDQLRVLRAWDLASGRAIGEWELPGISRQWEGIHVMQNTDADAALYPLIIFMAKDDPREIWRFRFSPSTGFAYCVSGQRTTGSDSHGDGDPSDWVMPIVVGLVIVLIIVTVVVIVAIKRRHDRHHTFKLPVLAKPSAPQARDLCKHWAPRWLRHLCCGQCSKCDEQPERQTPFPPAPPPPAPRSRSVARNSTHPTPAHSPSIDAFAAFTPTAHKKEPSRRASAQLSNEGGAFAGDSRDESADSGNRSADHERRQRPPSWIAVADALEELSAVDPATQHLRATRASESLDHTGANNDNQETDREATTSAPSDISWTSVSKDNARLSGHAGPTTTTGSGRRRSLHAPVLIDWPEDDEYIPLDHSETDWQHRPPSESAVRSPLALSSMSASSLSADADAAKAIMIGRGSSRTSLNVQDADASTTPNCDSSSDAWQHDASLKPDVLSDLGLRPLDNQQQSGKGLKQVARVIDAGVGVHVPPLALNSPPLSSSSTDSIPVLPLQVSSAQTSHAHVHGHTPTDLESDHAETGI